MEGISVTAWSWWRMEAGDLGGPGEQGVPPGLTSPTHPQWSLLSGNLVERTAPSGDTNGQQGRQGPETTLCCKGDLCNEGLQSWQSRASGTSAHLAWRLACGLLALLWAPWPVTPKPGPTPSSPWPGWRLRHPGLGAPQKVWGAGKG